MFSTDLGAELVSWLLVCAMVAMLVVGIVSVIRTIRDYHAVERECIDLGYAGYIVFNGKAFCIGVIDGEWKIKPVEEFN